jgi:lipoyl synthase
MSNCGASDKPLKQFKPARLNILPDNPESVNNQKAVGPGRFPSWLHRQLPKGGNLWKTDKILEETRLHTVCEEAKCPNLFECWSKKTATFLVMGKACTRNCGFCSIDFNKTPNALEKDEPERVAEAIIKLGLRHAVITMVARDDLPDGGSAHMVRIVNEIRRRNSAITIELLTSDFEGNRESLDRIFAVKPEIFNHNIETVRELSGRVRHKATYDRTVEVLAYAKSHSNQMLIKSGLMVGLGETKEQVEETLKDLANAGCDIVTIGQYLQPNQRKLLVKNFITPDQFKQYEQFGYSIGMKHMYCGPFIRSSYNAEVIMDKIRVPERNHAIRK